MQVFRTTDYDPRAQYDYWHSIIEQSFAYCDGKVLGLSGFKAEIEIANCGEGELTELVSEPVRYDRTASHVRRSGTDDFFISVMLNGEAQFRQNDRAVRHTAGSVMIYDSGRPYQFNYPEVYRAVLLRVPRPMIESRLFGINDLGGTLLPSEMPQARLIHAMMENLIDTAREEDLPSSFISPTLDLIAGAFSLGSDREAPNMTGRSAALNKIKRYMIDRIQDEDLSVSDICSEQNISVRSLNRAFASEGTTPMAWLRNKRLAEAYAMLREGRSGTVTDTAYQCGFKDLSYFGRCFKKTYGMTPKQAAQPVAHH